MFEESTDEAPAKENEDQPEKVTANDEMDVAPGNAPANDDMDAAVSS